MKLRGTSGGHLEQLSGSGSHLEHCPTPLLCHSDWGGNCINRIGVKAFSLFLITLRAGFCLCLSISIWKIGFHVLILTVTACYLQWLYRRSVTAIKFPVGPEKTTQSCWCHYWCVKLCINAAALQTSASANRWTCLLVGCCRAEWSKMKMNNKWEQRSKKRNDEGCNRNDSSWRSERRNELELSRNNMDTRENAENNQKWIKHRESKEEKL